MKHRIALLIALLALVSMAPGIALAQDDGADQDDDAADVETAADTDTATDTDADGAADTGTADCALDRGDQEQETDRRAQRKARREARKQFQTGAKRAGEQKYLQAIAAFCAAYQLDPQPDTLYNLGTVARLAGENRAALKYFQRYLAEAPKGRQATISKRFMEELQIKIEEEERIMGRVRLLEKELEETRSEADKARMETERARQALSEAQERMASEEGANTEEGERQREVVVVSDSGRGSTKRLIGTTLMGLGGLALGLAIKSGLDARDADAQLDGLGMEDAWDQGYVWIHEHGERSQSRVLLFSITGAVLVGSGITLYYLGSRDGKRPRESAISVAPSVGSESAGVQVSGRF